MQSFDPNYTPNGHAQFAIDAYRIVHINCPVDVSVYDANDNLVAQILDDTPQEIEDSLIYATYTEDGEKRIYLPANEEYQVKLVPTADGTLNYSVTEYSYETMATAKIVNYYDIPISVGNTLTGLIGEFIGDDIEETADGSDVAYTLSGSDGAELAPNKSVSGEDAVASTYVIVASSDNLDGGMVSGGGAYTEGAFATVSAYPYGLCAFLGWYENDELVSNEEEYRFRVDNERTLVAKFEGSRPTIENGTYELTITAETGGSVTPESGYYIPNNRTTLQAIPDASYEFVGWVSDGVIIENTAVSTTTFVMPENNAHVTAKFRSISSSYLISFDANGGTVNPNSAVTSNGKLTSIPIPTRSNYSFDGWFTELIGGTQVTVNTEFAENITIYAHWTYSGGTGSSGGGSGSGGTSVYSITCSNSIGGKVTSSSKTAKRGDTVTVTVIPDENYALDTLTIEKSKKANSTNTIELTDAGHNQYTFSMPSSNVTVRVAFKLVSDNNNTPSGDGNTPLAWVNPFTDVVEGSYYYDAVKWAVENNITNGRTPTTFEPWNVCSRAHAVTFLWRAAGEPTPISSNSPFTDVVPSAYYYNAVLWEVEQGITKGTTATTFEPYGVCNRGQIVTFLYRGAKETVAGSSNSFTDVPQGAYYYDAVVWAFESGVTQGLTADFFGPGDNCTRGQIVTFLYRHFANPSVSHAS